MHGGVHCSRALYALDKSVPVFVACHVSNSAGWAACAVRGACNHHAKQAAPSEGEV